MSLYEACAMGVPAVALPVVAAQTPTVRAFAQRGAAIGIATRARTRAAADAAVKLLNNPRQRAALARRSTQLVDGRGAWRAAAAVVSLAQRG
jgi:spore coat polysaccharide biosynthesis predicted glycosyltransferase SpsG